MYRSYDHLIRAIHLIKNSIKKYLIKVMILEIKFRNSRNNKIQKIRHIREIVVMENKLIAKEVTPRKIISSSLFKKSSSLKPI